MMSASSSWSRSVAALLLAGAAWSPASAAQHLVRPGDDWARLEPKLQPGDEIVLFPGTHRQAAFEGIAGTAERPIVIRSLDPRSAVTVEADDVGLHLRDVQHVRVENMMIVGARRAGIIVEGGEKGPSEHIELRNVYVTKTGDLSEKSAIRLDRTKSVTVRGARLEGWHHAGVHVVASEGVRIVGAQFVGTPATPDPFGVVVDGGSSDVQIDRCRFQGSIESAVGLGLAAAPEGPKVPAPDSEVVHLARQVTLERCLGDGVGRLATIGSCRDVQLRANTLSEPASGYEIVAPPRGWARPMDVRLVSNLFAWTPGRLKRFSFAAPDVDPSGVSLEVNLWWSAELPAARSILGEFVGNLLASQVLDVDPRFDATFRPREPKAITFGLEAP